MRHVSLVAALTTSILGASSPRFVSIMAIQGPGHVSPFAGDSVVTTGVVTLVSPTGCFVQDRFGDGDPATSDAIFAFTGATPAVEIGDSVRLRGVVSEYLPAGDRDNLTVTEITRPVIARLSTGHALPEPTTLGCNGRTPPSEIIDDDGLQDFDPQSDGVDFFESLESMRVRVPGAVAVGAASPFGEVWVLADGGACATGKNARGGITIARGDMNPERIQIDDALLPAPLAASMGDSLGDVTGVVSYRYGNFEILPEWIDAPSPARTPPEVASLPRDDQLSIASFNVRNLSRDQPGRIERLAGVIALNLRAPDILAVQEIQDDSGSIDDGVVDARFTYLALIDAIRALGGPDYDFRDIAPEDGQDGGAEGANIRVGLLFRLDRVVFVDRGRATAWSAATIVETAQGPRLSLSPGRVDPSDEAWRSARKPLAAQFVFADRTVFVVACHFSSRLGSSPLFGATQPPLVGGESQRVAQARIVRDFVGRILAADPAAAIVVLGDFNDFQFSETAAMLSHHLANLTDQLPSSERYTYHFEGNSQALDHVLVSATLARGARGDVVHVAAEFADGLSDHDPVLARLSLPSSPPAPPLPSTPVAAPNPFRTGTQIAYVTGQPGPVEVTIYDVAGRRVRELTSRHEAAGRHVVPWDGFDDRRREVSAGVYFVRVAASGHFRTTSVVRVR